MLRAAGHVATPRGHSLRKNGLSGRKGGHVLRFQLRPNRAVKGGLVNALVRASSPGIRRRGAGGSAGESQHMAPFSARKAVFSQGGPHASSAGTEARGRLEGLLRAGDALLPDKRPMLAGNAFAVDVPRAAPRAPRRAEPRAPPASARTWFPLDARHQVGEESRRGARFARLCPGEATVELDLSGVNN